MNTEYKLDTAATLFPPVTRKTNTSIYRIAAVLTQELDGGLLQQEVDSILKRFPAVSYTHLDVYKRQGQDGSCGDEQNNQSGGT